MPARLFGLNVYFAATLRVVALTLAWVAPIPSLAQAAPRVEITPTVAAPGETVALRGAGWPAGASLGARLYEATNVGGPSAALDGVIGVGPDGAFVKNITVPLTLFGEGSRGNLNVVPGSYTLVVNQDTTVSVATPFTVGAPRQAALAWGEVTFDLDGNGVRDGRDQPAQALVSIAGPTTDGQPMQALTDARGRFSLSPLKPGNYVVSARADLQGQTWTARANLPAAAAQVARADLLLEPSDVSPTPASLLAIQGSILFVGGADRLTTIDLSQPDHPAFLGQSASLGAAIRSATVTGSTVAVALTGGGLRLLDVTDPWQPVVVGSYGTPNATAGVAAMGQLLLVPAGEVLTIVDVSTPSRPQSLASYKPPGGVRSVTAAGRYAYVVTGDSSLRVVDLGEPTRPIEVASIHVEGAGYLDGVAVAHGNAFATFNFGHYTASIVIDVSDPSHPVRRLDVSNSLYTTSDAFALQDEVLYAANRGLIGYGSVGSISIAQPASPALVGSLEAQWNPLAITVRGMRAYVLGGDNLLHVLDIANPTALRSIALASLEPVPNAPELLHDERYFAETGYRIEDDAIWEYFSRRGALDSFGYPVSRAFTLLGCPVQVFQREIAQNCPGQGVQLMNVLDPDIFPYTRVNSSTFPGPDDRLKAATPKVNQPDYASAILDFVAANAPDTWNGQPVQFGSTFFSLVTPDMAGTDDPGILGLLNLEVWGAPISEPAADPHNPNFVYQRFQRGIMHFDAASGVTRGILLADNVKSILRNADLPPDLQAQSVGSRFFAQYCPGAPGWQCRPDDLPGTDLTFAFAPG